MCSSTLINYLSVEQITYCYTVIAKDIIIMCFHNIRFTNYRFNITIIIHTAEKYKYKYNNYGCL